eukprot:g3295.t1
MPIGDDSALYKREKIEDLLAAHADALVSLRAAAGDALPAEPEEGTGVKFDDIFLLRYLLSHNGSVEKATPPLLETLKWRKDNAAVLSSLKTIHDIPNASTFLRFQTVGDISATFAGWTTFVVRTAHSDLQATMNALSVQEVSEYLTFSKELQWRDCDKRTRETGILVKNISIIDMQGFTLFGADRRFFAALGDSSKKSAIIFPQLLGATICVNAPSFIQLIVRAFSPFMPQSALDKQRFCKVKNTTKEPASGCPFLSMFGGRDEAGKTCPVTGLPDFLGGVEPCPDVLVPVADRADRMNKATISARTKRVVDVVIDENAVMGMAFPVSIKYEVLVAAYGIGVEAKLVMSGDGGASGADKTEVVLTPRKIKAEEGLVQGTFEVQKPGTLHFEFDNSYSMLRSKSVQYRVEIATDKGVEGGEGDEGDAGAKSADVQFTL